MAELPPVVRPASNWQAGLHTACMRARTQNKYKKGSPLNPTEPGDISLEAETSTCAPQARWGRHEYE